MTYNSLVTSPKKFYGTTHTDSVFRYQPQVFVRTYLFKPHSPLKVRLKTRNKKEYTFPRTNQLVLGESVARERGGCTRVHPQRFAK